MIKVLIFCAISLLPLYFWGSGGIQLSHALLGLMMIFWYVNRGVRLNGAELLLVGLAGFVLVRECVWVVNGGSYDALLNFLYLAFNIGVLNSVRRWASGRADLSPIKSALFVAAAVAIGGILIKGYGFKVDEDGARAVGTFNNPNQLGYFAVCFFSMAVLLHLRKMLGKWGLLLAFLAAVFLSVASLSKAAMISVAASGAMALYATGAKRRSLLIGSSLLALAIVVGFYFVQSGSLDEFKFIGRLRGIGQQDDDSLAVRGYSIFSDFGPLQTLVGFGANGAKEIVGHEVHSTLASFFASYGVIGGAAFLGFHFLWIRKLYVSDGRFAAMTIPLAPMLYGITHNGSRFTIYWILLALSFSMAATTVGRSRGKTIRARDEWQYDRGSSD
jgi:hypothetical protein